MQRESLELPSGWNCSVVMNGKPMKLHNIITEGNKTDATIICQHGQSFSVNINREGSGIDFQAEDKLLSPDRQVSVMVDGEWMAAWGCQNEGNAAIVVNGAPVSLAEIRPFVFDRPEMTEENADGSSVKAAAGTITVLIEGTLKGGEVDHVPTDKSKNTRIAETKKKGQISSLVKLGSKVSDRVLHYGTATQTAYDKSHPFWTVTFHYHTQDMFNALNSAEDEAMVEAAARIHDANNPIEIDDAEPVIDVNEFSSDDKEDGMFRIKKRSRSPTLPPPRNKKRKGSRKSPRKAAHTSTRSPTKEPTVVKEEDELSLEETRTAEEEINQTLRRISRTHGNFVDLSCDDD